MSVKDITIFNNLTRTKEKFKTLEDGKVRFYSCGPTTYDFLHVGNARALVVGDLIFRILKTVGYEVNFVRNFTDVDDKIIERAKEEGVDPLVHSQKYIDECLKDMASLNLLPATHTPKVSDTMPQIIDMIKILEDKGFAYVVDGEVFYHVPLFKDYGKLSKKKIEDLQFGKRVEVDSRKKNPCDFVLWKPAKEGEPSWDSPWGAGRPGWHIECSAMAKTFLGPEIDLHHGGIDLMFPHHENEIAQSEAANGCTFSDHWCHNEFLNFGSEKMSKSLGNVITIRAFVETYSGEVLRHILSSVHYRSKMDWTKSIIERAIGEIERLHVFYKELMGMPRTDKESQKDFDQVVSTRKKMEEELSNDFNVPGATSELFSLIRYFNREYISNLGEGISEKLFSELISLLKFYSNATGLLYDNFDEMLGHINHARKSLCEASEKLTDEEVEKLIKDRKEARATKDWSRSDQIRDQLNEAGIVVKDNPDGTYSWHYK
ncbi:MAG: cysteine--tRNA ligase [Epsilonproteobacteria bacterium]|nr:MAG: cysteine--tRNA ligase [Campylobacterota bacterium]RLA68148.1 MAG: cysteine--tRNA ligase [Campylobacterota bacterium]